MSSAQQQRPVVVVPLPGCLLAKVEVEEEVEDHHSDGSLPPPFPLAFCFFLFSPGICMTTTGTLSGIL